MGDGALQDRHEIAIIYYNSKVPLSPTTSFHSINFHPHSGNNPFKACNAFFLTPPFCQSVPSPTLLYPPTLT